MFSNHFSTNFPQNAPVKYFENRSIFYKDMDKTLWLTFGATLYTAGFEILSSERIGVTT